MTCFSTVTFLPTCGCFSVVHKSKSCTQRLKLHDAGWQKRLHKAKLSIISLLLEALCHFFQSDGAWSYAHPRLWQDSHCIIAYGISPKLRDQPKTHNKRKQRKETAGIYTACRVYSQWFTEVEVLCFLELVFFLSHEGFNIRGAEGGGSVIQLYLVCQVDITIRQRRGLQPSPWDTALLCLAWQRFRRKVGRCNPPVYGKSCI